MKSFIIILAALVLVAGCPRRDRKTTEAEIEPKEKEFSITDYIRIEGSFSGYVFEDGRKLYRARKKGESVMQIYMVENGETKKLTDHEDAVDSYKVSPDEKKLLYLTSIGGNEQYNIYLYDLESGEHSKLLHDEKIKYENPVWTDSKGFLYSSNEVNGRDIFIYHYDISTGKSTLVVEKKGYNVITDAKSRDEFLFYTATGNNITVPYHYRNGRSRKIRGANKERNYIPYGFYKEGILMLTNEKSDMSYLQIWSNGQKKDVFKDRWEVDRVALDRVNRNAVAFCTNEEGYSNCRIKRGGEISSLPFEKVIISFTRLAGNILVYNLFRPDRISQPEVLNLDTMEKELFGYTDNNGIDVESFVAPELRKVSSFDGLEVPYFLYLPKKGSPPYRTIVHFHGGPASQLRPTFITTFQYYLSRGFAVVAPNVRGSSGYGQEYMDLDNYKLRMNSVKDGKAIIDALVQEGISKPNKFTAIGGSYGGFMVVASMAQYADDYICGINNIGIANFVNFLRNTKSYRRKLREVEYGPLEDEEFLMSISPTEMVHKIDGKLLVAHGARDPRVPVTDAYLLIERMRKAGKHVEKLIFEDEGHGYRKMENRIKYFETGAEFIERCNGL